MQLDIDTFTRALRQALLDDLTLAPGWMQPALRALASA